MSLLGELGQVPKAPLPRGNQASVSEKSFFYVGGALRNPHSEYERLASPLLPRLAKIVDKWVSLAVTRAEYERSVTDDEASIRVGRIVDDDVLDLSVSGNESRAGVPHVLEQQLQ